MDFSVFPSAMRETATSRFVSRPSRLFIVESTKPVTIFAGILYAEAAANKLARIVPLSQKVCLYARDWYFQEFRQNVLVVTIIVGALVIVGSSPVALMITPRKFPLRSVLNEKSCGPK